MTPGARLQAILEILEAFEATPQTPLDQFLTFYLKKRRYIGAKDRSFISDTVYRVFRHFGRIRAIAMLQGIILENVSPAKRARLHLLIYLVSIDHTSHSQVACWFNGQLHHPEPLFSDEKHLFQTPISLNTLPLWAQAEIPPGLLQAFQLTFQEATLAHGKALQMEAPVDIRVNTLKTSPEQLQALLGQEGIQTAKMPFSPMGLRLHRRRSLSHLDAFQHGLFEFQDEGSQLIALLTGAKPGEKIVDFCAGAGGKALALAALMRGKGRIWACDVAQWRLRRAQLRLRRADVQNVILQSLENAKPWLEEHQSKMDRVLVDAPCSGVGTWRRQPEKKWMLMPQDLERLVVVQQEILRQASQLVRVGGELCYATCSLFSEENERQISHFLEQNPQFEKVPMRDRWEAQLPDKFAPTWVEDCLRLTPLEHGTDGFFMAILKRVS